MFLEQYFQQSGTTVSANGTLSSKTQQQTNKMKVIPVRSSEVVRVKICNSALLQCIKNKAFIYLFVYLSVCLSVCVCVPLYRYLLYTCIYLATVCAFLSVNQSIC